MPDKRKLGKGWIWHHCSTNGWRIATPEFTLNVGIAGPFTKGFLQDVTHDRSFNLAISPGKGVDARKVEGIVNGDRNGLFSPHDNHAEHRRAVHHAHKGKTSVHGGVALAALDPGRRDELQPVTTKNVARSDVLFPKQLLQELDAQCGSPTAMHLSRSAAATAEAEMEEDA